MAQCFRCGDSSAQASCCCAKHSKQLRLEEISAVVAFLRSKAGFAEELSLPRMVLNLTIVSRLVAKKHLQNDIARRRLVTYGSTTLMPLLALLLEDVGKATETLHLARKHDMTTLAQKLKEKDLLWIGGLLVLYNLRYHPGGNPTDMLAADRMLEQNQRLFHFSEPLTCDIIARLLPVAYGARLEINLWGYMQPGVDTRSGTRYVEAVYLAQGVPSPALRLVLCHELVHCALWLRGTVLLDSMEEEVLCNAVAGVFANSHGIMGDENLPEAQRLEERRIIQHRMQCCARASKAKHEALFDQCTLLIRSQQTNSAIELISSATQPVNRNGSVNPRFPPG